MRDALRHSMADPGCRLLSLILPQLTGVAQLRHLVETVSARSPHPSPWPPPRRLRSRCRGCAHTLPWSPVGAGPDSPVASAALRRSGRGTGADKRGDRCAWRLRPAWPSSALSALPARRPSCSCTPGCDICDLPAFWDEVQRCFRHPEVVAAIARVLPYPAEVRAVDQAFHGLGNTLIRKLL